ncbi:uncharacterized protein A4U43_C04F34810 [Asparagus officinalis]|uniref:Uncharacterized protein n=1 Tax=Asparagus officinalis TaxID=4686 RepID=A0A5P1F6K8_ASPOF|nr:uncharacterized protein A4U43_C04F34810 [Asparagus officinalis]
MATSEKPHDVTDLISSSPTDAERAEQKFTKGNKNNRGKKCAKLAVTCFPKRNTNSMGKAFSPFKGVGKCLKHLTILPERNAYMQSPIVPMVFVGIIVLKGKVAIITGASSGIGAAAARLFAANVVIADIQDQLGLKIAS